MERQVTSTTVEKDSVVKDVRFPKHHHFGNDNMDEEAAKRSTSEEAARKKSVISKQGMAIVKNLIMRENYHSEEDVRPSPMLFQVSIKQQAAYQRDFLGRCAYLHLDDIRNVEKLPGNYSIVYARGDGKWSETFTPSRSRHVIIVTTAHPQSRLQKLLNFGFQAAAELTFNGQTCLFGLSISQDRSRESQATLNIAKQPYYFRAPRTETRFFDPNKDTTRLGRVLASGIDESKDNVAWRGIKKMSKDPQKIDYRARDAFHGFNFLELDLVCNGDVANRMVIVAVKLEDNVGKDASSAFMLKQLVEMPESSRQFFMASGDDVKWEEDAAIK